MLEDLTNNQGFLRALALVLRLKPGGLLFAGVPCNSFAFMSQGGHKRSQQAPMGAPVGFVVQGNILAARSCLLFLVALVRSTVWALENPARSSIISFPYVEKMLGLPLFRHTSVFWWSSQLHSNTSCACCHDLAGRNTTKNINSAQVDGYIWPPDREAGAGLGQCVPQLVGFQLHGIPGSKQK